MILDGELVAYDDTGKPNFQWLQKIGDNPNIMVIYQVHITKILALLLITAFCKTSTVIYKND